ncbi:hypothetical protein KY289_001439 [Solanum tuberosum]|nr:hypothetical protein KY289_001439 [Solanum tuberosum]
MSRAMTKTKAMDWRQPIRELHVGVASWKGSIYNAKTIPPRSFLIPPIMWELGQVGLDKHCRVNDWGLVMSTQRPGKEVATSSQRKRVQSGGNVRPALAVPHGQTWRFGLRVVVKEGNVWWKKNIGARYFTDVCMPRNSLAREFP